MESHGFACDTEFASSIKLSSDEIVDRVVGELPHDLNAQVGVIFTGGEPALQLDDELVTLFRKQNLRPLCIETNGTRNVEPLALDWVTLSPKVAEHALKQTVANEVKYVRGYGQPIPKTRVGAEHYLISPAFDGLDLEGRTLAWCTKLVKENPQWRLSVQMHKTWAVR